MYIQDMDFTDEKFTTVRHRNLWGEWTFVFEKSKLCSLNYSNEKEAKTIKPSSLQACTYAFADLDAELQPSVNRAYKKVVQQLNEYLLGKRKEFKIPYKLYGTEFQVKVWESLKEIPFGETRSYKDIAEMVGNPKAVRAVGGALHVNPIPFILPCHRVIGKAGDLVGFGLGLEMKRRLLVIEGAIPQEMFLE
ncbi:methylated-DNA-[protein]-cysteine S-methyltransferase [Fibrobacter sp. UWR4]|nr:methylated-DNA-[protein]-cysteine S-methyltransferase [Fibrobacter sp. UWR4]PZW72098.1 methylated-DNA-[protein]-cysteine S-methyltransferase [Fibrobacter sp. UWR1]